MKRLMLAIYGAVAAASLMLPAITEGGFSMNHNETLLRDPICG
jgi:hypothetical protein